MIHENYLFRNDRLLRGFEKSLNRVTRLLVSWLGEGQAKLLFRESRKEYEDLLPRIPFIGKNYPLLVFLLPTTRYLAVYRALQRQGFTIEEAGYLAFELAPYVCAVDRTVSELLGWGLKRTKTLAEGSIKCDFRFKKGGQAEVDVPQSLQEYDRFRIHYQGAA